VSPIVPSKSKATNLIIVLFFIQFANHPARISDRQTIGGYIFGYDASGPNNRTFSDSNPGYDNNASANPTAVFYGDGKRKSPAKIPGASFMPTGR
jgi:hypothetical protein